MHWFMLILLGGLLLQAGAREGMWGLQWMLITEGILIVSILFHEFAHCFMAVRTGAGAEQILIWPLGGLAFVGHADDWRDEIKITGIGPLSSFLFAGLCLGGLLLSGAPWSWTHLNPWHSWFVFDNLAQNFTLHAVRLNLILGLFNLCVPAYPLDGGRIMFILLSRKFGKARGAEMTATIAIPVGFAMAIWGLAQNELFLILIGIWVIIEGFQMRYLVKIGEFESHPAFAHQTPEYQYMPDREPPRRRPGFFARWRQRRAERRALRQAEAQERLRQKVDAVLEKVSREGIGSLSPSERKILDEASRRTRGE